MKERMRVYIAGPYTKGDVAINCRMAFEAWHVLADAGFFPFCPHLTHFLHLHNPRPYADWIEQDLAWLEVCHALIRLPGESKGADGEVCRAVALGIPVYLSISDFFNAWNKGAFRGEDEAV